MTRNKIVIENYGINPPQNSRPLWGMTIYPTEEDVIASIDLQASLQKLSPTEREIILLCNQGYSIREIEAMTNLPRATVQDIKDRATNKLKEMMNEEGDIFNED